MSDEKRIKDFEPATELLIDDWFAVDSPSQGTRKMQASMFQEGLQTQITTNTENIALHSGQISVLQQGVGNIGDKVDVLDAAITVEEYSASKLYAVDEDCVYEGVRYKCITAIETPEAFTPSHWQAISIEGELNELNSSLSQNIVTERFDMGEQTIAAGGRGVFTISVLKTGYTPLGIIEIALSNNGYYVGSYTINSNGMAQVVMHSGSSIQTTQRVYITVIYKKN